MLLAHSWNYWRDGSLAGVKSRQRLVQKVRNFLRRLESLDGLLGEESIDDRAEPIGNVGIEFADRTRAVVADAANYGDGAIGSKRRAAGTHRVQHAAQAKQI